MQRAALRGSVAAAIVAVLAGIGAGVAWQPWAPARAGETAIEEAAQCGATPASVDAEIQARIEQEVQAAQQQADADAGGGWVVLNNRGYSYAPPPGVQLDPLLFELAPKPDEATR
jgi:hypothetical protein